MIDKNKVLIISSHHRRSLFFEESIKELWHHGYNNIIIQDTGSESWGKYQGPYSEYITSGSLSYDRAVIRFKNYLLGRKDFDYILMADNDCFLDDTGEGIDSINTYINDFISGGYNFSCHLVSKNSYQDYEFNNSSICHIHNQSFTNDSNIYPGFTPVPHWENSLLLIDRPTWEKLSDKDVGHGRVWLKAVHNMGAKMGAHYADYKLTYSHYGPGWFHVGNLMAYYYALQNGDLSKFNPESELDMSRLGYFLTQAEHFGDAGDNFLSIYSQPVQDNIRKLKDYWNKGFDAWNRLTTGTCMEQWNK